jgi:hypothetical protein
MRFSSDPYPTFVSMRRTCFNIILTPLMKAVLVFMSLAFLLFLASLNLVDLIDLSKLQEELKPQCSSRRTFLHSLLHVHCILVGLSYKQILLRRFYLEMSFTFNVVNSFS